MDLQTLTRHATREERAAIDAAIQRANARPAILVTIRLEGRRRYVVSQEDEHILEGLIDLTAEELRDAVQCSRDSFTAQWAAPPRQCR